MRPIVISEPDIDAAVSHLRTLRHSMTASMPVEWSRKRFLDTLNATLRANPKAKGPLAVGPGVWALVQPFGVDLAGAVEDDRRQVWILIRATGTDPNRLEILAV